MYFVANNKFEIYLKTTRVLQKVTILNETACTFIYVKQKNGFQEMIQIILNLVMCMKESLQYLQYAFVIDLLKIL